jgi:hypothetical protein
MEDTAFQYPAMRLPEKTLKDFPAGEGGWKAGLVWQTGQCEVQETFRICTRKDQPMVSGRMPV